MTDAPLISPSAEATATPATPATTATTATTADGASKRSRWVGRHGPRSPHAPRFRVATVILFGLAAAALVAAIVIGSSGRDSASASASAQPWSVWKPTDSGNQGAREIADYLAPTYRISAAHQLDVVTVVNLESQAAQQAAAQAQANGTTASAQSGLQVAVRPSATSSQVRLLGGNTIAYNLCGIGAKNCAIATGRPSSDRLLLLRREALELALYSFKYLGTTDNILAILPPGHTQTTNTLSKRLPTSDASSSTKPVTIAVLFQRQELAPLLGHPLDLILPEQAPPTVAEMAKAPEADLVAQATARGLFSEQLQQAQDGSSLMILAPLPAQ